MKGYIFPLTDTEIRSEGKIGYPFINANRSRLVSIDLEESSIDLGLTVNPLIVNGDVVYRILKQYFVNAATGVERILLVSPSKIECETKIAVS